MKFKYSGYNAGGQAVADVVEAGTAADATDQLRREGVFVLKIDEAELSAGSRAAGQAGKRSVGQSARLKHVSMFSRQLQVLLATGTPLVQSLGALQRQSSDVRWRAVLDRLRTAVEDGSALSAAMGEHPQYFDSIARSLVAAGESAGNLPAMLDRLATLTRKELHVRRSIVGAMIYPSLLIFVALGVLVLLLTFVLPRFSELFKSLDTPLPATTQILMAVSTFVLTYWYAVLAGLFGIAAAGWATFRSDAGKRGLQTLVLRLPQFGPIVKSFATARIARLLGILIQARVPLINAMKLAEDGCSNHHYRKLIASATESVTRGGSLAAAFGDNRLIAVSVQEAILSGERTGQLGPLLTTLADFLEENNEVTVKSLTSILEPLILIALGLLVGLIAVSMFLPLFDLTAATRGGG